MSALPVAVVAGIALIAVAPPGRARWGAVVFAASVAVLLATSAAYHRGRWSRRARAVWMRLDHAAIFVLIAGSYTPVCLSTLAQHGGPRLLATVWVGAITGAASRVAWPGAPRWVYVPPYLLLGWAAILHIPAILAVGGPLVAALLFAGGGLYSLGAVVYALRRPNPWPRSFGSHEIFHACTVAALVLHFLAVSIITQGARP